MTDDDHATHGALADELVGTIARLRADLESRSDPLLTEIADAMELLLRLTTHAHDHVLDTNERLTRLERER